VKQDPVLDFWVFRSQDGAVSWVLVALAGAGVGLTFGVFGAGGSAFATPVLALLGVPAPVAVASPLPAMLPASVAGARQYLRAGLLCPRTARLAVVAGLPAVVAGALVSPLVGGEGLLVITGALLFVVGARMLVPASLVPAGGRLAVAVDEARTTLVIALIAGAAFLTGLLANGGGFLLVPIFVLVLGFTATRAAGTSMVVVAALMVPTLATHWYLGNIDWAVAGAFAVGVIPATVAGARLGRHVPEAATRRAFGVVLVAFSLWFLATRVLL
jgi:uncharacterized membrane protein YfcA